MTDQLRHLVNTDQTESTMKTKELEHEMQILSFSG